MNNKEENETKEKAPDFYEWFDSLEFEITPLDKKALLTDKKKGKGQTK